MPDTRPATALHMLSRPAGTSSGGYDLEKDHDPGENGKQAGPNHAIKGPIDNLKLGEGDARVKLPLHVVWPRDVRDPARDVALEILLSIADRFAASAGTCNVVLPVPAVPVRGWRMDFAVLNPRG